MYKLIISLLTTASMLLFIIGCTNSSKKAETTNEPEGVVDIFDARTINRPMPEDTTPDPFYVEITRVLFTGEQGYEIIYFQNEDDSSVFHITAIGTDEVFNKADYKWLNDTTVYFRLFETETHEELKFKITGTGPVSQIIMAEQ